MIVTINHAFMDKVFRFSSHADQSL